jgi:hypothetical protein
VGDLRLPRHTGLFPPEGLHVLAFRGIEGTTRTYEQEDRGNRPDHPDRHNASQELNWRLLFLNSVDNYELTRIDTPITTPFEGREQLANWVDSVSKDHCISRIDF